MTHLLSITLQINHINSDHFPFNIPLLQAVDTLTFPTPVTFFVGENGSGKSTLLETIAVASGLPTVGSAESSSDDTLAPIKELARYLKWSWRKRTRRGFFMRSEDFFGFAKRVVDARLALEADLRAVDETYHGRTKYARTLAKMPYVGELQALRSAYGDGLDAQSHGESYLKLFQARFVPDGLYLLDEPEAPLSPMRQLSFMALMKTMLNQRAQFIIATHSPILLAYPGATIYLFADNTIRPVAYNDLEHITLTRDFLNHPEIYLRHLLD